MARILLSILLLLALRLNAQPVITNQPANQVVVWGSNATFSVMVTGIGPFTYQWRVNGTNLPNNIISTVAGGNLFEGLAATNTILASPQSIAVDAARNLYIADTFNNVIRKVGTNGTSQIIVGTWAGGFSGDGGPATNAMLLQPASVILDSSGNVLFSDSGNNRVRKVSTNGIVSTIAGNGIPPLFPSSEGNGGQATNANLNYPMGLALDSSGNLYIADNGDNQIRKVTTAGIISCIANTPGNSFGNLGDNGSAINATLNFPQGVAVDASGNIYIADTSNNRIRKINTSGTITTIAGTGTAGYTGDNGSATAARINNCLGVTVGSNGNIYVVDSGNHCIRKITNGIITTIAGVGTSGFAGDGGAATNASLNLPAAVSLGVSNNLFIADQGNNRIRQIGTNGIIMTVAGRDLNDGAAATNGTLNFPFGIARDAAGNFFIADSANARIRKLDTNGIITTFAGSGAIGFSGDGGAATNARLNNPYGVAVDISGNVFIAERGNGRVRKVDANGIITTYAGNGGFTYSSSSNGQSATNTAVRPWAIAVDTQGNLFIAEGPNNIVRKVATNQIISLVAGTGSFGHAGDGNAATNALLAFPSSIFVNDAGEVFFSEWGAIRKVNTNGVITTLAGVGYTSSGYSGDGGAATNAKISNQIWGQWNDAAGNLFIADTFNNVMRKVNTNGIITTIAGNGTSGFSGDGGSALSAKMSIPRGIIGDSLDSLYVAESGNNRLRKISYLESANQPSFTVTNANLSASSNNWSVIITSMSGSVTSSVAVINLQLPPVVPVISSNVISFNWSAVPNLNYQLQYTTNLAAPVWQNLGNAIASTNSSASTSDIPGADVQRFYRVQLVP